MSNATGMFSGALMTVSLLAVPGVAVFGLPVVGGAVAEADAKDGIALGGELGSPAATSPATTEAPAFAPLVDAAAPAVSTAKPAAAGSAAQSQPHHLAPTSDRHGAVANAAIGLPDDSRLAVVPEAPARALEGTPTSNVFAEVEPTAPAAAAQAAACSWEDAVQRLGELGIRDFHLTNGEVAGEFHFSCSVKEAKRNLTRRFEAEGATPVAAAADVLAQVEACFGTR